MFKRLADEICAKQEGVAQESGERCQPKKSKKWSSSSIGRAR